MSCLSHPPIIRHHHILGGCGLGSSWWPQSNVIRAKGQPHLLHQRVHRTHRVHPCTCPRNLQRFHGEKLRHVFVLSYLWGSSLTNLLKSKQSKTKSLSTFKEMKTRPCPQCPLFASTKWGPHQDRRTRTYAHIVFILHTYHLILIHTHKNTCIKDTRIHQKTLFLFNEEGNRLETNHNDKQ